MPRPIDRFRAKCRFEPRTGCVLWIGGTTSGQGNKGLYGSFWYDRRRWFAHRWAAHFIHGINIDGLTVDHCCPNTPDGHPDTLCVQHLRAATLTDNVIEGLQRRPLLAQQSAAEKQLYLFRWLGFERPPPIHDRATLYAEIPFYPAPAWLSRDDMLAVPPCRA